MATDIEKAPAALQELVAASDTGARKPQGLARRVIFALALAWALFQYWYASPLPFTFGIGILNDTEARSLHLAFALGLAFLAWPAFKGSPREHVPVLDVVLALAGAFAGGYFLLFYGELATRPGLPTTLDIVVASTGLLLLLEATRRAVGWPMAVLAALFVFYSMAGPLMPELLAHRGASLNRLLSHLWLTTEGVYGIALGVSAGTIFVYVLFGTLLDRAGGGNYMMQVSFAMLGHLRGGPAKVAVVSSALNGMISGSSVSNVVSGGIFTIPLMKKAGYGGVKAGAIETMSSVNGQIMPPVMGAAAFLMVEYVGIPYSEVVRHALLPAVLSYIGLLYIVHLEALKLGMQPIIERAPRPWRDALLRFGLGLSGSAVVVALLYYLFTGLDAWLGPAAPWATGAAVLALYFVSVQQAARSPDLPDDIDIDNPHALDTWPTVRAGLHYLMPIGTLIWCLMVEQMSPSLAAFWAITVLIALMATQRPLIELLRGRKPPGALWLTGWRDVVGGFEDGSRNMIGIGVATATAGIIVGGITLTGLGLRMTEFVEFVSQGDVMVMLLFIAFVCLVLGLGVPTTANYVLVATLMAPVVVELGARSGLVIPLIAVHLFVFYYGIMGDITPPVGLATFAAAAISGEDAIQTGIQGSVYALRTVILPFIWIFNPQLLLIDVHGGFELLRVVLACTLATLLFAAITMSWFRVKSRWWEQLALLAAVLLLFRPDWFMDRLTPEHRLLPPTEIYKVIDSLPPGSRLALVIEGTTIEGEAITKTVAVNLAAGASARERLTEAGLQLLPLGDQLQTGAVKFGSRARKSGIQQGWTVAAVHQPTERPSAHWFYLPALALTALVWWSQGRRLPALRLAPA